MITDAGAAELMAIAVEIERAPLADRRDPERPYVERGELARRLRELVYAERREVSAARRCSFPLGTRIVGGRAIEVTRRGR